MDYFFPSSNRKNGRKRHWGLRHVSHYKEQNRRNDLTLPPAKLDILVESPPLTCYGPPATSTGALFSGRLRVAVTELAHRIILRKLDIQLISKKTTKRPVSSNCLNCAVHSEELTRWSLLAEPILLVSGYHEFPFSCLFPGHLPTSCDGSLGRIEYFLRANTETAADEGLYLEIPIHVRRALIPGNDISSSRSLPPRNLTCLITRPSVVHPIGKFPVQMVLSGIIDKDFGRQTRWCLRRLMWRIEEHQRIVSTACQNHAGKLQGSCNDVLYHETRIVGHSEETCKWKTDFGVAGGAISIQFDANIDPGTQAACRIGPHDGFEVNHDLVIEFVVADELCTNRKIRLIAPTGPARLFSMKFQLHVTEHSGLGISWDNEIPPTYEVVPARAPAYSGLDGINRVVEDYYDFHPPPLNYGKYTLHVLFIPPPNIRCLGKPDLSIQ
ncbi:hypothetical protein N7451_012482 [Penicillium sp. IBT 35674x]|nr:hypothetical protein N7451_012482 [Penicillium sp. IBT 35674x]